MMRIILFSTQDFHLRHELVKDLLTQLNDISIEAADSVDCLVKKLRQPLNRISVIIIWVQSVKEFETLFEHIGLFESIRLILVLPNREENTISLGVKLNPSFISYKNNGNQDIVSVLKHIQRAK